MYRGLHSGTTGWKLVFVVGVLVVLGLFGTPKKSSLKCANANATSPLFAVYPHSTLVEEKFAYDRQTEAQKIYHYEVQAAEKDVLAFFSKNADCSLDLDGTFNCLGKSQPLGYYFVQVDPASANVTHYTILSTWNKCF